MGLIRPQPVEFVDPLRLDREGPFPPLGVIKADAFTFEHIFSLKRTEFHPVHLVFPVKDAAEGANLKELLARLDPLAEPLIDKGWLAFGGDDPGDLINLTWQYRWLHLFQARRFTPPDQLKEAWGKGAVMRALLYYLIHSGQATDPRTIVQFIDADIVPAYFQVNWLLGAVGSLLWFSRVEAAKIVYFRPQGGRLNTFLRSLLALFPHEGIQRLQDLIYLLSGEMAATLKFWSYIPFKTGYGIETMVLLSLALDQVRLHPERSDLEQVAQVFVGNMDHRHAPLQSTRSQQGLDQMGVNVFQTVFETLEKAGVVSLAGDKSVRRRLLIPSPGTQPDWHPEMLPVEVGEATLSPLKELPEIAAALNW
jgi:hypothetical protein